jgi:hypothetical protein
MRCSPVFLIVCEIFVGLPANYKIAQMAGRYMLGKIDARNMCKYIYRTGRLSPKDDDRRKNLASSIRQEKLKERKMKYEVITIA